jgi:inner membrane protein
MKILEFFWTTEFWFLIGVLFLIVEVLSVSFYFLFLGIGALLTALAIKLGFADALWIQFTIFAITSIGSTLAFRSLAVQMFGSKGGTEAYQGDFVGERAVVTKTIGSGDQQGKVSYRGTEWAAASVEPDTVLEVGTEVIIKSLKGMVLVVG